MLVGSLRKDGLFGTGQMQLHPAFDESALKYFYFESCAKKNICSRVLLVKSEHTCVFSGFYQ